MFLFYTAVTFLSVSLTLDQFYHFYFTIADKESVEPFIQKENMPFSLCKFSAKQKVSIAACIATSVISYLVLRYE